MDLTRGARVGPFEVLDPIGQGGMARVVRAWRHDTRDRRDIVALKVLRPDLANASELVERFDREADVLAVIPNHPNLVRLVGDLRHEGQRVLALQYVAGESLRSIAAKAREAPCRIEEPEARLILRETLRALEALHAARHLDGTPREIVHRDVTPGNVLVSYDGAVLLTDYGLATTADTALLTTVADAPALGPGTLPFMAPEQRARGRRVDGRADLWAAGATIYWLLSGQAPFGPTGMPLKDLEAAWQRGTIPDVRKHCPEVSKDLAGVIGRLLRLEPGERFRVAAEALTEFDAQVDAVEDPKHLRRMLDNLFPPETRWRAPEPTPVRASPAPPAPAPAPPARVTPRIPRRVVAAAVVVLGAAATIAWSPLTRRHAPVAAAPPPGGIPAHPTDTPVALPAAPAPAPPPAREQPAPRARDAANARGPRPAAGVSHAPAAAPVGWLVVRSAFSGDVALDHRDAGRVSLGAPLRIALPPGEHHVRVDGPGFQRVERDVAIRSGETVAVPVAFRDPLDERAAPR